LSAKQTHKFLMRNKTKSSDPLWNGVATIAGSLQYWWIKHVEFTIVFFC
jgi:hypothetical protein